MAVTKPSRGSQSPKAAGEPPTPRLIADMYERWTLDSYIIEVAQAIAPDFVNRPRQYREVPGNISEILQNFWYLSGTNPGFPDIAKRQDIFTPLLGPSDGMVGEHSSQFHMNSKALRERARAFTERQVTTGEDNLRRAFLDEAITFRSYLEPFEQNAVVTIGNTQTRNVFDRAVEVLLNDKVTGVFGRPPASTTTPSNPNWPLDLSIDSNGGLVIKFITAALPTSMGSIAETQLQVAQRIGFFGKQTISGILEVNLAPNPIDENDGLIQLTYSWYTALKALTGQLPS